jgi:hypothetical protein
LVRRRRRAWIALGACGVVIILAAAAGWFFWLPAFRPALRAGEAYGIDVSAYQGRIDWRRVAGQQVSFAYIKASEGGDFVDRRFAANWSGARRAGVPHGAYHFFSLCTPGLAQARNFLRVVPAQPGELAPALDLELSGNCSRRPARRGAARRQAGSSGKSTASPISRASAVELTSTWAGCPSPPHPPDARQLTEPSATSGSRRGCRRGPAGQVRPGRRQR